jgi:transcriptional regulator with XRE-family HTH domain
MTLSEALRAKIRDWLHDHHWSQRDFARRLGMSQGSISYFLAKKRRAADLEYYAQLAQLFEVSLSALVAELEQRMAGQPVTATPTPRRDTDHADPFAFCPYCGHALPATTGRSHE